MNNNEPFVPAWAESALTKPPPVDPAELKLLREFYEAWLNYHTIPKHQKDRQRRAGAALIVIHEGLQKWMEHANRQ